MGKGKGKVGKSEKKALNKAAPRAAKLPGLPKPPKQERMRKSKPEKKTPTDSATLSPPAAKSKSSVKSLQQPKWPSLFKRHLGLLEAHVKALDRVMQSMKAHMGELGEQERKKWELGEEGNWLVICGLGARASETLESAREAAKGILPLERLNHKSSVAGTDSLTCKSNPAANPGAIRDTQTEAISIMGLDNDGDSEMSDASEDSYDSDSETSRISSDLYSQPSRAARNTDDTKIIPNVQPAIDSSSIPVAPNGTKTKKKNKKRAKDSDVDDNPKKTKKSRVQAVGTILQNEEHKQSEGETLEPKIKKRRTSQVVTILETQEPTIPKPHIDFTEVEAQLHAEVAAGLRAQEEEALAAAAKEARKAKKKRKRSAGGEAGEEIVEKKLKIQRGDKNGALTNSKPKTG